MNNEIITKPQFQDTGSHLTAKIRHTHKPTRHRNGKANARESTSCAPMPRKCISCVPRALLHVYHRHDQTSNFCPSWTDRKANPQRNEGHHSPHPPNTPTHIHTHTNTEYHPSSRFSKFSTIMYTWSTRHFVICLICFGYNFNVQTDLLLQSFRVLWYKIQAESRTRGLPRPENFLEN